MPNSQCYIPRLPRLFMLCGTLISVLFSGSHLASGKPAEDEKPAATIKAVKGKGAVFGGETVEFRFRIEVHAALKGKVVWRLAAGSATLAARELELDAKPNAPAEVVVKLEMPPTKDGAVFQTRLTVSAVETGARKPAAVFEGDVWIFPKNPFSDRTQWLKSLKISLYDPKGDTTRLFIVSDIPFDAPRDLDALAKVTEGLVIVGEGVAFKDEKGLDAALHKLAAVGRSVLCLAPSAGTIGIPSLEGLAGSERELTFRRDVVKLLDKRLTPDGWPTDEKAIASTLVVKGGEEGKSVGEVTVNTAGWQWSEVRFTGGGHWAVCGAAVVTRWDDGPIARYLLTRLLERMTEPDPEQPKSTSPKKENSP